MKRLAFPKSLVLIKALIPGLVGILMLTLEKTIRSGFLHPEKSNWDDYPHLTPETGSNWLLTLVYDLGKMIFESYDNYFAFIFMMLFVNVFFHGSDIMKYFSTKRNQVSFISHWKNLLFDQELLKHGFRSLVRYSLIFCFFQVMWIALGNNSLLQVLPEVTKSPLQNAENLQVVEIKLPRRILEQEEITSLLLSSPENVKNRPSLSIGKVLGQVDIYAGSIKLSKDGKIAFVTTFFPATLQIIDIRDPEDPIVLSTFNFPRRSSDYVSWALLVSPDETKLYISNFDYLQVIDISKFKSPSLIAGVENRNFFTLSPTTVTRGFAKPNLLLSGDGKFLFVSGYGLLVFDISVPTAPVRIHLAISQTNSEVLVPSSIAFSDDRKTLYYTDGSLWIFHVEDPKKMELINSFNLTTPITSLILSNDAKTAFVLGLLVQEEESEILLSMLDISDIHSIKTGKVIKLGQDSICQPVFLERTPENRFMMILFEGERQRIWNGVLTFDTQAEQLLSDKKLLVKNPLSVIFTDDYQRALVGNGIGKLEIVELYLDFPNKHAFSGSPNILKTFDARFDFFSLSKDEKMIYSVDNNREELPKNVFTIHQFTSNFSKISDYEVQDEVFQIAISQDSKRAFLLSVEKIEIVDISNPENIKKLGEVKQERKLSFLSLSGDGKTGFLTLRGRQNILEILDLSDPQNVIQKASINLGELAEFVTTILSHDEQTLFIIANKLLVYNVSDILQPKLIANLSLRKEEYYISGAAISGILSPDGKILFMRDEYSTRDSKIYLVDVSNISSPQMYSDFRFPPAELKVSDTMNVEKSFWVSPDSKTLIISKPKSLVVIDISNLRSPKYLGSIRIFEDSGNDYVSDFSLSNDGQKAIVKTVLGKLLIVAIGPVYTTFIKQDTLMLGERYSIDVGVLKMNELLDYHSLEIDYRFTKFAFVEQRTLQNLDFDKVGMKPAPSWMNFDLKTQTLSVEARRKNDIGRYKVYFGFSAQIEVKVFSTINETIDCEDLAATLLAVGYLDSQRYLTEDFGELKDFMLPSEYSLVKKQIYNILKRYSFGTFNELRIVESLGVIVDENSRFEITTSSMANLKVEIGLIGGGQEAQFLSRHYGSLVPVITSSRTKLILEGSLKDINDALQEVVINLPKGINSCDGEITIDDKLNPMKTELVKNISRLFNHNQSPRLNKEFPLTIQNQIDKESLKTGQYFQIKLNQKTFFDNFTQVEDLNYQLAFMKGNNETNVLPPWLSFSDMTLMGTAPEEIFDRTFELKLIVKNEFQELKVPFTLQVSISSNFVLKLLMKYSPYILSIVGLIISANKIFNVICKGTYKHPKNFVVKIGEKITSEVIFPISFIREEIQEAKRILRLIEKKVGVGSIKLSYFMGERRLDKLKVLDTVKSCLDELTYREKKSLSLYLEGDDEEFHPRRLINQIILNTLVNQILKLNEEKETRECFEKIKGKWPLFVEWDLMNSAFKINDLKFKKYLQKDNHQEESTILTNDMEYGLLDKEKMNIDLLKDAILAYAFDCQNIDAQPVFTQLNVKEKIKTNFLKRFLKLDLGESPYREKGKIGFGIGYSREYSTICFNGLVKPDMRNKTIVIQITDLKHKILKELWLFEKKQECSEEFLNEKSENEAKGKDYEIF